jgi:hypothetical protein
VPKSIEIEPYYKPRACGVALFIFSQKSEKEDSQMKKDNRFATNEAGVIKAPKSVKNAPKATVVKGKDLRDGKGK